MIDNILFFIILVIGFGLFARQVIQIRKNILLGRDIDRSDRKGQRMSQMIRVAFGQQKMFKRWVPAVLHGIVYVSFLVINIEMLEIIIDGIFGTHRVLAFMGPAYSGLMWVNEWLALLVIVSCTILLIRRKVLRIKRFQGIEMTESKGLIRRRNYSHLDAAIILYTEIVLMSALFLFNTTDLKLHAISGQAMGGSYPISEFLLGIGLWSGSGEGLLHTLSVAGWWGHIVGILAFLNFLPISKHFHVILAFPNVYYSNTGLNLKGTLENMPAITEEMKAMLDPEYQPVDDPNGPKHFGAKDIPDLHWKNLMDAYTCTECGRCTDNCPANITGKKLSPRKIVMDVRDRLEEIQKFKLEVNDEAVVVVGENPMEGAEEAAAHTLLSDYYISQEELNACTSCNACVEACPVNIDQLDIIFSLRRYLIMEESAMPEEWAMMANNIENSGNPWAMPAADRFNWKEE